MKGSSKSLNNYIINWEVNMQLSRCIQQQIKDNLAAKPLEPNEVRPIAGMGALHITLVSNETNKPDNWLLKIKIADIQYYILHKSEMSS